MSNGIYVALSGAMAQSTAMDVNANNIANATTTGYHAERMHFQQALAKAKDSKFVTASAGITDKTEGQIQQTGRNLDCSIQGDGYLTVGTARGVRYTRDGALRLDNNRNLVTTDGNKVLDTRGKPITVPDDAANLSMAPDGTISGGDGNAIGQMALVKFDPKAQLTREGSSLYTTTAAPLKNDAPQIAPGTLESANFNIVNGVVDLVRISRNYEALHKMIESYKDIDSAAAKMASGG